MIPKKLRLIVAFHTTHDAIAFEAACAKAGAEGRLIPLPKEISAGCGLAWSAPPENGQEMRDILRMGGIEAARIQDCLV